MPIVVDHVELPKILSGKAKAISRFSPSRPPLKEGDVVEFFAENTSGKPAPIVRVRVMGVDASTFKQRTSRVDASARAMATGEGFSGVEGWSLRFSDKYGKLPENAPVWRISFAVVARLDVKIETKTEAQKKAELYREAMRRF